MVRVRKWVVFVVTGILDDSDLRDACGVPRKKIDISFENISLGLLFVIFLSFLKVLSIKEVFNSSIACSCCGVIDLLLIFFLIMCTLTEGDF